MTKLTKEVLQESPFNWPEFDWRRLNPNDFLLYFGNGLFKLKVKNQPTFMWMKITGQSLPKSVYGVDEFNKRIELPISLIEDFDFSYPPTGAYNFKNSVVFFSRRFSRQWKKGLCNDSVSFENILDKYKVSPRLFHSIEKSFFLPQPFMRSPKDVTALFNCAYLSFEDAYRFLKQKKGIARAVSRNFVLSLGANSSDQILWFNEIPIGTVKSARPEIQLSYQEMAKDVLELFPQALLTYQYNKEQTNVADEDEILNTEATASDF